MSIPARFTGLCLECNASIKLGDLIVQIDDVWQHERCESIEKKDLPVCPECWIMHVGECA